MTTARYKIMMEPEGIFAVTTVEDAGRELTALEQQLGAVTASPAKTFSYAVEIDLATKLNAALREAERWEARVKTLEARLQRITDIAEGQNDD